VYSWVNGSDVVWSNKKSFWFSKLAHQANRTNSSKSDDTVSHNRFRDSEELRYSLRSLEKYAPWIRKIYLVTDNQIPYWLNLENPRIRIVPHAEIFPNQSDLPVFSSPAIETHIHRIKGLSKKFIYFNDDVFLGAPVSPEDFYFMSGAQRVYQAWDVPKCAPGCSDSWIGDGYCDKACNVSSCNFDFPDCVNGSSGNQRGRGGISHGASRETFFCAAGCPDSWLGDKVCDQKCKTPECGWDVGDCGVDLVVEDFPGLTPLTESYANITIEKQRQKEPSSSLEIFQNNIHLINPSSSNHFHPQHTSSLSSNETDFLFPVALTVPYGSYAAYVNLSYLPCTALQISSSSLSPLEAPAQAYATKLFPYSSAFSPTCSESDIVSPFGPLGGAVGHYRSKVSDVPTWTNFTYTSVNYTITPVPSPELLELNMTQEELKELDHAVSFSVLVIKHNLLIVLLRGHEKEFSDAGTPKKEFSYRYPLDIRFNISGYNLVTGINVTALFSIRLVSVQPKIEIDHSIPEDMGRVEGYSASCLDMRQFSEHTEILQLETVSHSHSPFRLSANSSLLSSSSTNASSQQGIVFTVRVPGISTELYQTPLHQIQSLSTITLLSGESYRHSSRLCDSIAHVKRLHPIEKREWLVSNSIPLCDSSVLLGNLFYPSGSSPQTNSGEVEIAEPLHLLLHVPIPWDSAPVNASGVGFPIHGALELFVTSPSNSTKEDLEKEHNSTLRQSDSSGSDSRRSSGEDHSKSKSKRILCLGGSFRWGTRKIVPSLLTQTNSSSFGNITNATALSSNQTNSSSSSSRSGQEPEVEEKVDTYASSLRHVNSLYHKAFGAENRKVPAHMPHMIDV
jgi:hypothetical protein